eukprot:69831-Chlamydomonas_euryale.AAC.1
MTGLLTGGSRPTRQKSGLDGDPSHFDPIREPVIPADAKEATNNLLSLATRPHTAARACC